MLNGIKPNVRTGNDFEPIPMDKYTVVCVDVNMETNRKFQSNEEEDVLNYKFQILDDKPIPVTDGDAQSTRGRLVWHKCRLAYNDRSWLYKLIKSVTGRDLTKEEVKSFDYESIVGKQVDVVITQKESNGKIYNNIIEFSRNLRPLELIEGAPTPGQKTVIEKATVPATAPVDEAEQFIGTMEKESKQVETPVAPAPAPAVAPAVEAVPTAAAPLSEEDELRQKLAAIEAKKKADAALQK